MCQMQIKDQQLSLSLQPQENNYAHYIHLFPSVLLQKLHKSSY